MIPPRRFALAFALFGAATLALQAVFLREMLAVFGGSERVVGAVLGGWLLLGGLGSALAGAAVARRLLLPAAWPVALLVFAVLGPATVPFVRALPRLVGVEPGLLPPFWAGTAAACAALAPAGLLSGALFALGVCAWGDAPGGGERAAGRAYSWDAVGCVAGGLLLSAALGFGLPSGLTAALAAGVAAVGAAVAAGGRRAALPAAAAALLLLAALFTPLGGAVERASLAFVYPGEEILARREIPSGQVVVTRRQGQTAVYTDGRFAGSPDVHLRAEEVAHLALLHHPDPRRVLAAGGVLAGWTLPILQHRPEVLDLLEADAALRDLLGERLAGSVPGGAKAASLFFGDVRMRLRASPVAYDVVLLPGGAPETFAQARLLSAECFQEARAALRPGGVLAFPVPGFRSFQNRPHRLVLASIRASLRAAFPFVRVLALESGFLCVASEAPLPSAADLARRWEVRGLKARELVPEAIGSAYHGPADRRLAEALDAEPGVRPTLDDEPVVVGYQSALAEATADGRVSAWGRMLLDPAGARGPVTAVAMGLGLVLALIPGRRKAPAPPGIPFRAAFLAGLAGLALEVLWLDGYQIARGTLYGEIGVLLALFMAGAAGGAWLFGRASARLGAAASLGLGLSSLAALAAGSGWLLAAGADWPFLPAVANLLTGSAVGWAFAAAAGLASGRAGLVYAADLAGAALGSVLTAGLLVPLLGLPMSGAALALACAPAAIRASWLGARTGGPVARIVCVAAVVVMLVLGAAKFLRGSGPGAAVAVSLPPPPPREVAMEGRTVMGTFANAALVAPAGTDLGARGLAAAFAAMDRADARLSDYRDDSDVARLRALPDGASATIDPWTAEALAVAALVHRATGGAFDPTIRPVRDLYRFTGREEPLPAPDALSRALARVGLGRHAFDAAACRFAVGPGGADLDLGAVGKGYANDRAAEAVEALGIRDALFTIGGEVLALGVRLDGHPWRIGIRHPLERGRLAAEVDARPGEAFSTSGGYERFFLHGGVRQPHVLDALTGAPVAGASESVTVLYLPAAGAARPLHRAGAVADALATGLMIVGPGGAARALEGFPGAEAVFLLAGPGGALRAAATPGAVGRVRFSEGIVLEELRAAETR